MYFLPKFEFLNSYSALKSLYLPIKCFISKLIEVSCKPIRYVVLIQISKHFDGKTMRQSEFQLFAGNTLMFEKHLDAGFEIELPLVEL